jgi:2-polyprenyl-3-methyl-5-hydroxy-6-metoxy-1,4-benzoquinol methylase
MFYSKFSEDYEQIFPFSEAVYSFIKGYLPSRNVDILDIGCATGHYCGRFTKEGFNTTGIDLDSDMINTAENTYPGSKFKVLNLVDIDKVTGEFSMVYSTGNVMAHISMVEFETFLNSLKRKMQDSGIWIFQVINWDYILQKDNFTFSEIETEEKIFVRQYTDIKDKTLTFNTELKNKKSGGIVFKDKVTMYPIPSIRYISMHKEAGFELLGHFSDYSKSDFNCNNFSADIYVFKLK